jgi:tetratricopeptide (TPR) repeat protein
VTNPIDINVTLSKDVTIKINDLEAYETHVAERIAQATAALEETREEDQQVKAELRQIIAFLKEKLSNSKVAFQEHQARSSEIENLLDDVAVTNAIGNNRINAALASFANLQYDEIDAVFAESEAKNLMNAAKSAYGRGLIAEDAVRWQDAYTHYKRAVHLHETTDHLKSYAHMTWRLAKGDEAVAVNEKLVTSTKTEFGDKSPEYATQLNNLASAVRAQGRYVDAEGLFREALKIDADTIGTAHPNYAIDLNNLAGVVEAQGRYAEAEALYREALQIDADTIGTAHPDYAIDLNNLAGVVQEQGRYGDAEGLYREAMKIDADTIGAAHPDYAKDLCNLGVNMAYQKKFTEARDLMEQALVIQKATLPADHPDIASTEHSIANVITAAK